ncbi:MAG: penicillin-binding protein 2, partial [Methyloversatilis sp.]|nr:penicillin-binding protein 2 [Methyloversatilis sp.]
MTDLHSPEIQLIRFRRRVLFAGGLVLLAFGLLLARFVWLQVVMHDYYQTRAEDNRIALLPVSPNRGLIMDRNGSVLAR